MGFFKNNSNKCEELFSKMLSDFVTASVKNIDNELIEINEKINSYKGIIVYPEALDYYPLQRPQHILRVFAKKGYLCLFCASSSKRNVQEIEPNLFIIKEQKKILPLIKNKKTLFLINYFMQYSIVEAIEPEYKMVWLDIIGNIEQYEYYNNYAIKIYKKIMNEAILATYSDINYKIYYEGIRENIKLMKDGIMVEDFITNDVIPSEIKKYIYDNKKVLCYYGDIDNNIDFEYIKELDMINKYNILLIGETHEGFSAKEFGLHNTYFFNTIEYSKLKTYISHFDLIIFPLKNNDKHTLYTKVLESMAMKLKIASLDYEEIKNLKFSNLYLYKTKSEIMENIDKIINDKDFEIDKKMNEELNEYKWENIINKIL